MATDRHKRVLVIEDRAAWQEALREALEPAGYEVRTVATRLDALGVLDTELFQLLVVDICLEDHSPSKIDGMEFLRELTRRGLNEAFKVVIFSGYATRDFMREAFAKHGVEDFVHKSEFDQEEFLSIVNRIFDQHPRSNP